MPEARYRVSVKALIYDETGRFLLSRESDGRWDIPGGWLDHGEIPEAGLKRELYEESRLDITSISETPEYVYSARRIKDSKTPWVLNICYEVKVKSLDFTPSPECEEVRFFTPEEALKVPLFENVTVLANLMIQKRGN